MLIDDRGVENAAAESDNGWAAGLDGSTAGLEGAVWVSSWGSGSASEVSTIASGRAVAAAGSSPPKVDLEISENRRACRKTGLMRKSETRDGITPTGDAKAVAMG